MTSPVDPDHRATRQDLASFCRRWGVVAACALLGACASVRSPDGPAADALSGRLSVRVEPGAGQPGRSLAAAFELRGTAREGALDLNTPLGTTLARARWAPGGVQLTTPDGEQHFADLDGLARESLGEAVPLEALFDWLRGRPWPGAPSAAAPAGASGFTQLGWSIDLGRYGEGWLVASRSTPPAVQLRARLDR